MIIHTKAKVGTEMFRIKSGLGPQLSWHVRHLPVSSSLARTLWSWSMPWDINSVIYNTHHRYA